MNGFPFSDSHIISKMLSEQGLKPYNCSELEVAYGTFSALLMTRLQYEMHSEVFIISGLVDFFFFPALPFILCCFTYSPTFQLFLPRIVIYIFSLGLSVLLGAVFISCFRWLGSLYFYYFFKSVDRDLSAMFWGELRDFTVVTLAPKFKSSHSNCFAQASQTTAV